MRIAVLILLCSPTEACYCSHGRGDDASVLVDAGVDSLPDVAIDVAPDMVDAGPAPMCGVAIVPTGPFCGDGRPCVVNDQEIVASAGFEFFPRITATSWGDVLVAYRGRDRLPIAVLRDGALAETRMAPMASFGSGWFARTPTATFVAGREEGTNDALLVRVEQSSFIDSSLNFGDDRFGWALVGDDAGCVHLLLSNDAGVQPWRVRDGVPWRGRSLGPVLAYGIRIDSVGRTHVVHSTRRSGEDRVLTWWHDEVTEPIDVGSEFEGWHARFEVLASAPHVLYTKGLLPEAELVYATRGESRWERQVLTTASREGCSPDEPSTRPGQTCRFLETTYHGIAVLADASGDVRLLYGEVVENATLTARCGGEDRPPDACGGWSRASTFTGTLYLANPADGGVHAVHDVPAIDGRAVLEGSTIHVAVEVPERDGRALRYVSLATE